MLDLRWQVSNLGELYLERTTTVTELKLGGIALKRPNNYAKNTL